MPQPQVQSPNYKSKARLQNKATTRRLIKKKVAEGHLSSIRVLSPSCKSKAPKRRQCPNHKFKDPTTSPKPGYKTKPQQEDSLREKVAGGHLSPYELSASATSPKPRREDKAPTTRPKLQLQVQRAENSFGGRWPPATLFLMSLLLVALFSSRGFRLVVGAVDLWLGLWTCSWGFGIVAGALSSPRSFGLVAGALDLWLGLCLLIGALDL